MKPPISQANFSGDFPRDVLNLFGSNFSGL